MQDVTNSIPIKFNELQIQPSNEAFKLSVQPLALFSQPTAIPELLVRKRVNRDSSSNRTKVKTEEATDAFFNKVITYKGFLSKGVLDFLNKIGLSFFTKYFASKVEGFGYVEANSFKNLSKHIIKHLTGDEKISEQYQSCTDIQSKIQYLIKKHHGLQGFQSKLQKVDILSLHKFKHVTKVDVLCALDHLDPNNLKIIECSNQITADIKKNLKPGDILLCHSRKPNPGFDNGLTMIGQKLAQLWLKGELEPESEKYCHAAIYIGNGKFAEATGNNENEDLRIVSFDDYKDFMLKQGDENTYRICRPQNNQIAKHAALFAKRYTEDKSVLKNALENDEFRKILLAKDLTRTEKASKFSQLGQKKIAIAVNQLKVTHPDDYLKTTLLYSIKKAISSPFRNASFGPKARQEVWQQVIEVYNNVKLPREGFKANRDYFCSEFVSECFQRGNIKQLMPKILKKIKEPIPTLTGNAAEDNRNAKSWIDKMMKKHPHLLDKLIMKYHARNVTPQKLDSLVRSNPHLFKEVAVIVPPKAKVKSSA